MSIAQKLTHYHLGSLRQLSPFFVSLFILSGCTHLTSQTATEAPNNTIHNETKAETSKPPVEHSQEAISSPKDLPQNTSSLCVFETTKGIAEVTEITADSITFKFYPGDKYFQVLRQDMIDHPIKLEQELKAIARTPLSGPCLDEEFELVTTVR